MVYVEDDGVGDEAGNAAPTSAIAQYSKSEKLKNAQLQNEEKTKDRGGIPPDGLTGLTDC